VQFIYILLNEFGQSRFLKACT